MSAPLPLAAKAALDAATVALYWLEAPPETRSKYFFRETGQIGVPPTLRSPLEIWESERASTIAVTLRNALAMLDESLTTEVLPTTCGFCERKARRYPAPNGHYHLVVPEIKLVCTNRTTGEP